MSSSNTNAQQLCLQCGLCCNGVIFADVELRATESKQVFQKSGFQIRSKRGKTCFNQPCIALKDGRCQIYDLRPQHCRTFDCSLLKQAITGEVDNETALQTIRRAKKQAAKVNRLLIELGDTDTHVALGVRFRRMEKRIHTLSQDANASVVFGELSVAMLKLNVTLATSFYPDSAE